MSKQAALPGLDDWLAVYLANENAKDRAMTLQHEYQAWRVAQGLAPSRADKARLARMLKAAARCGRAYAPWADEALR